MRLKLHSPEEWRQGRNRLIQFAIRFGERRLTAATLRTLRQLDPSRLQAPGNHAVRYATHGYEASSGSRDSSMAGSLATGSSPSLAADSVAVSAWLDSRLVGLGLAVAGGEECCMVVVHPEARSLGVGGAIVQAMMKELGGLICMVAADNTASMALCFRLGMTAVSMHRGPTGKPTLRFERRSLHDKARIGHSDPVSQ